MHHGHGVKKQQQAVTCDVLYITQYLCTCQPMCYGAHSSTLYAMPKLNHVDMVDILFSALWIWSIILSNYF